MLKRYSFTLLFSTISIFSIFIFYTYVNANVKEFEKVKIETVSGDEEEGEQLKINGHLSYNNSDYHMNVSAKEMRIAPITFLDRVSGNESLFLEDMQIRKLQERYKGFMRGKYFISSLYEDNSFLISADLDSLRNEPTIDSLTIDIFDKANETTRSFSLSIPEESIQYEYGSVEDVQLLDQQLSIIMRMSNDEKIELIQATINVHQQKLIDAKALYSVNKDKKGVISVSSTVNEDYYRHLGNHNRFLSFTTVVDEKSFDYVIDIRAGRVFQLPEKLMANASVLIEGNKIYVIDKSVGALYKYDVATSSSHLLIEHEIIKEMIFIELKDSKLYFLNYRGSEDEQDVTTIVDISILDINKGEEVYRGKIDISKFNNSQIRNISSIF